MTTGSADSSDKTPGARLFDPERHIDALAAVAGIELTPHQRSGVIPHLAAAAEMAALLDAVNLPHDELALAPVFAPRPQRIT